MCVHSVIILFLIFFFFSSRRRHTRFDCDWSSDVCSSDLPDEEAQRKQTCRRANRQPALAKREIEQEARSEEHTSELQSQSNLVCRLLLEKKNISRPLLDADALVISDGQIAAVVRALDADG